MPLIHYQVSNYKGTYAYLNTAPQERTLLCRKLDLYRSIVTVGNPSFLSWRSIREFGLPRALYESILEKVALVASNIESNRAGMRRHPIFDTYILDKKRIVSYNLGMAFAKLYSEKLLKIPSLIHIESLKKSSAVKFAHSTNTRRHKEPDLVGQTGDGNWHIFEAKGISTSESNLAGKIAEAKLQIRQVSTIQGALPTTGTACATYIGADRIFTHLEDPPPNEGKGLKLIKEKFYDAYYAPFLLAESGLKTSPKKERIDGLEIEFFDLVRGSRKIRIGLDREVAELIRSKKYDILRGTSQKLEKYSFSTDLAERYSIGLDGFVFSYRNN
ncbi:hypothetical protein [Achromobacter sp. DH1f]|uniref:hypothetical protein n=1 Tax=Achromobacter sp. DH1f TaxID=1397275 RepID=UPI0012FEB465|nr:hypothetical protein [Achromobacter sp. DH1f]